MRRDLLDEIIYQKSSPDDEDFVVFFDFSEQEIVYLNGKGGYFDENHNFNDKPLVNSAVHSGARYHQTKLKP